MRASCGALPIFFARCPAWLGRESFLPYVGDLWVVASEGEVFPSFTGGAEDTVLRGGRGAGNCVVERHVRA